MGMQREQRAQMSSWFKGEERRSKQDLMGKEAKYFQQAGRIQDTGQNAAEVISRNVWHHYSSLWLKEVALKLGSRKEQ